MNSSNDANSAITLELDEGLSETIRASMALGGFASVGDFFRSAAFEWHQNHLPQDVDVDVLQVMLEEGLDSGDAVEFNSFMTEITDRLAEKRSRHA
jgi:Arc/MetJ-type ribon-helix-helix transcriptional regulator